MQDICWNNLFLLKNSEKNTKKCRKREKNVFQNFPLFSPYDAFKKYLTKEVVTQYTFKEYIHLPSKKFCTKKNDKQGRY